MNNYLIDSAIQQTLMIIVLYFVFRGEKWGRLGLSCAVVSLWAFLRDIVSSVFYIAACAADILHAGFNHYESMTVTVIPFISYPIAVLLVYIIFYKTKLSEKRFLSGGKLLFFITGLLLILSDICGFGITRGILLASFSGSEYWTVPRNEMLTHIEVIVISSLCLSICLSLMFGMNRLIEYTLTDGIRRQEIKRYKDMVSQYEKQVNVRHDMKNHLISMSALAEQGKWEKLKEYLSKVMDSGVSNENEIETGNDIVNAIINIAKRNAENAGVKFDCEINISNPLNLDDYDLCIIWGNLLDNAVLAAGNAEPDKFVHVQAETVKKNFVINIKNSADKDALPDKFQIKHFGTGLMNVKKVIEKRNGVMNINTEDGIFEVSVLLPSAD